MKPDIAWYAVQVMTGKEREIAEKIAETGAQTEAPVSIMLERRHGQLWQVQRMVIPSYVFVRVSMTDRMYYYIRELPNVYRILGANGPEPIPDEQMMVIGILGNDGRPFGVSTGQMVDGAPLITDGPLLLLADRIVGVDARQNRATLAIPVLGETKQVDVAFRVSKSEQPEQPAESSKKVKTKKATKE